MRVEHEYTRGGALAYLAAWDVHRAKVFGRCEQTTGIEPFDRLVGQVMTCQHYAARRVFWVVDNGSSHRPPARPRVVAQSSPHTKWGESVHMIGPAIFEPPSQEPPGWLDEIELPVVLVTTSSVRQADVVLVRTALHALADEPVHIVATLPAGALDIDQHAHRHATVTGFVPHSAVLDRAVCVVTHGGMGITQKALARGIPVCVVPFGRDQFEVARRVEIARCGTRLAARRLTVGRLRDKILSAMTMTVGADAVASGFAAIGGMSHGAKIVERHLRLPGATPRRRGDWSTGRDAPPG